MKPKSAEELAQRALQLELLSAADLNDVWTELGGHHVPIEQMGLTLVRRELLTGFQLERLQRGEQTGFFYGRAKLLYQVGAGSFARVYRAVDADSGGIVAVKVLRSRYNSDPEKCRAFRREGEVGRHLRHPNIVAIRDVGQVGRSSYITMEFVEGRNLRELVRIRGAFDIERGLDLVLQMIAGLEYAHQRGVTHRDLKASNILISSTGQAKLVDFGLAGIEQTGDKSLERLEHARTIDYSALEKLSGVRDDDIRSDIYFLGTLAYLTLGGAPALGESRDRAERADPRRFRGVKPLAARAPHLPREVVDVVARMMHLDPVQRFQTVTEVRRAVESIVGRPAGPMPAAVAGGPGSQSVLEEARGPKEVGDPEHVRSPERSGGSEAAHAAGGPAAMTPGHRGAVMVVEATETAQQALRGFFSALGWRVLITENPQRALVRFSNTPIPADCLVISAQNLGEPALEAFNRLTQEPFFANVPAILVVGPKQASLAGRAAVDAHRRIVSTPIRSAEIARVLDEIVRPLQM